MGLSAALQALGEQLAPPEAQWGEPELPNAYLCPRLRTTYSPRAFWHEWKGFGAEPPDRRPQWARCWLPPERGDGLGLSLAPNSNRPGRYGLKGLPPAGRKQVWRALALLEERRELLSFWTVSLPTGALRDLARANTWPLFQDRVRKLLARKLTAAGLPALVVGVVELQPRRSRATGMPCPHLHVVFQGRTDRSARWALSRAELDGVIAAALATAGVSGPAGSEGEQWLVAAGNVQQVRKSVQAYLAKYMTKGGNDVAPHLGGEWENLLPRQWWFWTKPLRALVLAHVFPIVFSFLRFVHEWRRELEEAGWLRAYLLDLPDPRAPATFEIAWLSCEHLARVIALWQEEQWDQEWQAECRLQRHGAELACGMA